MEVTCDRCQAEYEFEEALVAEGGTTVKCTNCGHLFKVRRSKRPDQAANKRAHWTVREREGNELYSKSLTEIVRLIRRGELSPDHAISHSGKSWKRLGDIEELGRLFRQRDEEADQKSYPMRVQARAHPMASGGGKPLVLPTPEASAISTLPPPTSEAPLATIFHRPRHRSERPDEYAGALERPYTAERFPGFESEPAPGAREEGPEGNAQALALARPAPSPLDPPIRARESPPDDPLTNPLPEPLFAGGHYGYGEISRARRRRMWTLVLLLSAGASAAGVWGWPRIQSSLQQPAPAQPGTPAPTPAQEFVERADRALSKYRPRQFELAITEYTKALAFREDDPHLLSSISRTYARWSQQLRIRAELMRTGLITHASDELSRLVDESDRLTRRAKRTATTAARKNPGNPEAEIALSDALRLTGNLVAARSELDRARANEAAASAETLRVAAHLAIAEAGGNLAAGRALAAKAVAQDPEQRVFRVLFVHILISERDLVTAEYHLHALKGQAPGDPLVSELEQALTRAPDVDRQADATESEAANQEPTRDAGSAEEAVPPEPAEQDDPPKDEADNKARVKSLAAQGERLLERGMTTRAMRAFEAALELDPDSLRSQTGLAYVYLERGRLFQASRLFRRTSRAGYPDAYIGLGATLRKLKRTKGALHAYRTYARRFPNGRSVSIAQRQIQLLEEQQEKGTP
ncbi:MAG: zinc-ribbon domain-containing protein [Myxococcales bacterium]|nr:zinc-ribbon domain-containing protein [Myxococcales bacterium]MDD9965898.1 zinc-ribbon domain-containing protein [Myxococcales bacterium]